MRIAYYIHVILMQNFGQPLNRVLVGNFEYRMFLRCRHAAKVRFIKLRSDVLVKLQLLDNKRGVLLHYYTVYIMTNKKRI